MYHGIFKLCTMHLFLCHARQRLLIKALAYFLLLLHAFLTFKHVYTRHPFLLAWYPNVSNACLCVAGVLGDVTWHMKSGPRSNATWQ